MDPEQTATRYELPCTECEAGPGEPCDCSSQVLLPVRPRSPLARTTTTFRAASHTWSTL